MSEGTASDNYYVSTNPQQVAGKIMEGEAVLINLLSGMYYSMADVGAFVWRLIEQGASADAITQRVVEHYDVGPHIARRDLDILVDELRAEGLVVVSTSGRALDAEATPATKEAYTSPVLEKFTDMAEMFALDPPLPRMQSGE